MQSITNKGSDKLKMEDGSYAYLDPSDESSIRHSMESVTNGLKEMMISKVISSTMNDAIKGNDRADRRTLVSNERHTKFNEDTLANRFGISTKMARKTRRSQGATFESILHGRKKFR